jgi:hypothetical protein
MRDITLGDTFYVHFTTRAFATGIPTQLAGSPVVKVLESNNATPITAGITLSVDRATVTGLNEVEIVATGGNGYEAGKTYSAYISTGTVGGVSVVGEIVETFTVQSSAAAVDLANGTDGLGAIKADTAATLVDTNELQTDWTNGGRLDLLLDATLADTNELQTDWVNGGRLDLLLDAVLADTNELQTDWTNGGRLDLIIDDILLDTAEIGAAGAGLTNINLPDQTMNITGNITGNLSGSVGSVTGSVGSVTAEVTANLMKVNSVSIIGTGATGDLWRAA